jgi:excinuclease ABC subunit C
LDLCPGVNPDLKEYKKNLKKLAMILQGKSQTVLKSLKSEMAKLSKMQKFEEASKIRDKIFALQKIIEHSCVISQEITGKNFTIVKNTTTILQGILGLNKKISRIECYDISNTQGNQSTGSMVVFVDGQPEKSQYKKFKIKIDGKPNDIAMLKETITRRLAHSEWNYPEIMLIDGGIAQLNVAIRAKDLNLKTRPIKVISIAKGRQELWVEGRKEPIPLKNLPQEIYNLVKNLDDEAHRFAITYHRKLRRQNLLQ